MNMYLSSMSITGAGRTETMTMRLFQTPIVLPHCGPVLLENEHVDVKDCGAMPSYVKPGATRAEGMP